MSITGVARIVSIPSARPRAVGSDSGRSGAYEYTSTPGCHSHTYQDVAEKNARIGVGEGILEVLCGFEMDFTLLQDAIGI